MAPENLSSQSSLWRLNMVNLCLLLFYPLFTCVDPDLEYGSGSTKLLNTDQDPQHWSNVRVVIFYKFACASSCLRRWTWGSCPHSPAARSQSCAAQSRSLSGPATRWKWVNDLLYKLQTKSSLTNPNKDLGNSEPDPDSTGTWTKQFLTLKIPPKSKFFLVHSKKSLYDTGTNVHTRIFPKTRHFSYNQQSVPAK